MDVTHDRFMFNATSANKAPGSGVMERVTNKHLYKELSKIPEWRKMLSNEYMHDIEIDNVSWPSLEHYFIAECFYANKPEYDLLQDKEVSLTKHRLKAKTVPITQDVLNKGLRVKFSKKYMEFYKVLKHTRGALLTNWKRGNPVSLDGEERYVEPNEVCHVLMEVRDDLVQESELKDPSTTRLETTHEESGVVQPIKENNIQRELKILSKKDFDDFNDFIAKYDQTKNTSINILTIYEKTNIIGVRMEQLSMGAEPLIDEYLASTLNSVKLIAVEEYNQRKIPFVVCRNMPNNKKEYWKLEDMILC